MYSELYLMLTESCPNRCQYCYIKNRDNPNSMSLDLIYSKLDHHKPTRVIFFGGEPLLKLDIIKEVMKKYYGKIKFQVVTSTVVNWKEFIEFNKEYPMNEIQVSWDGFNDNRISVDGRSISEVVLENINYAKNKIKFDIKCVISNDNVDEFLDIHKTFKDLKKYGISGQIVLAHRTDYADDYYEKLEKSISDTMEIDHLYTEYLNKIKAYLMRKQFASCDVGKYIVIDPYGRESYCTALSQTKDKEFDRQTLQNKPLDEDCIKCKYRYMCDGGCRYERYEIFGDQWQYNHLESTCKTMEIYDRCLSKFIKSLSIQDRTKLLLTLNRYNNYMRDYYEE